MDDFGEGSTVSGKVLLSARAAFVFEQYSGGEAGETSPRAAHFGLTGATPSECRANENGARKTTAPPPGKVSLLILLLMGNLSADQQYRAQSAPISTPKLASSSGPTEPPVALL